MEKSMECSIKSHNMQNKTDKTIENISHDDKSKKYMTHKECVQFIDKVLTDNIPSSNKFINKENVKDDIISMLSDNMTMVQLCDFIADYCASKTNHHPIYNSLASTVRMDYLHSITSDNYFEVVTELYENKTQLVSKELYNVVKQNTKKIQAAIDYKRDYLLDYFGIKTLERSYLLRIHKDTTKFKSHSEGKLMERPQHLFMRVALSIHKHDINSAIQTYDLMSNKYCVHATPTLFNAGTPRQQLSSCFLINYEDSMSGISSGNSKIMEISKYAGGIGISLNDIRAKGSLIRGTNGFSEGIVPLCVVLSKIARYVNQGGKRKGSIAVYIEPWHADIFDFCELRRNVGDEDSKARDLFLALWTPDLFMKRVEENGKWSLMCPDECPGLTETYGDEFEKLYEKYESEGRYRKQINAQELWFHIMDAQNETGMPYMLYKDNVNNKSNQKNIGTIKSSNLCAEIMEYAGGDEIAVCNLASLCLPRYVCVDDSGNKYFDFNKLMKVSQILTRNLNKIIDNNFYPVDDTKKSNMRNRPIGVGVQGLADVYNMFGYPFDSEQASALNKQIFETIYFGSLTASNQLAIKHGSYQKFKGSPFSEGKLQFHLWGKTTNDMDKTLNWQWDNLIESIKQHGTRNSLITALMPTASTAQIMGNYESFEPRMSNIFTRSTLAGEYVVMNEHLVNDLIKRNLWNDDIRLKLIVFNGSVQNISEIPDDIKQVYKTAFEMGQKTIVQQAVDRGCFVDQSQSMNLFVDKSGYDVLQSAHFYGWRNGLKTGMYYLRSQPAVNPLKFGVDASLVKKLTQENKSDDSNDKPKQKITYRKKKSDNVKIVKQQSSREYTECEICSG